MKNLSYKTGFLARRSPITSLAIKAARRDCAEIVDLPTQFAFATPSVSVFSIPNLTEFVKRLKVIFS